jgi:predicted PurR-regulated permease PerM
VLFLFFLLVSGGIFLHRLVEILPRFRSKRQVVEISQQIESDTSAYLVTITIMNAAEGIATGLAMWLTGVGDPILWGDGGLFAELCADPRHCFGRFDLSARWPRHPLASATSCGAYFGFHLIEGETVRPLLLARRFTLNPVLVIISLVFWFWMWGIPGVILSMPMLAITKIICDRLQPLAAFGHFLEG